MRPLLEHYARAFKGIEMKLFRKSILFLAIAFLGCFDLAVSQEEPIGRSGPVVSSGAADIGGAFSLTDQNGDLVTHEDIKGKPHIIYFGFAYCPDVCPFDLQRLGAALAKADPEGEKFRPVFITIDPERDTVSQLKLYVGSNGFPKNLIGLTGSQSRIDEAKAAYKVYAQKMPDPDSSAGYNFNHSNLIYFMDKDGKFIEFFSDQQSVDFIANRLSAYADKGGRLKKYLLVATLVFLSLVFVLLGRMGKNAIKSGDAPEA